MNIYLLKLLKNFLPEMRTISRSSLSSLLTSSCITMAAEWAFSSGILFSAPSYILILLPSFTHRSLLTRTEVFLHSIICFTYINTWWIININTSDQCTCTNWRKSKETNNYMWHTYINICHSTCSTKRGKLLENVKTPLSIKTMHFKKINAQLH